MILVLGVENFFFCVVWVNALNFASPARWSPSPTPHPSGPALLSTLLSDRAKENTLILVTLWWPWYQKPAHVLHRISFPLRLVGRSAEEFNIVGKIWSAMVMPVKTELYVINTAKF